MRMLITGASGAGTTPLGRAIAAEYNAVDVEADKLALKAPEFLLHYALQNFFFHLTAAYAILRSRGVPLGEEHFDGFHSNQKGP